MGNSTASAEAAPLVTPEVDSGEETSSGLEKRVVSQRPGGNDPFAYISAMIGGSLWSKAATGKPASGGKPKVLTQQQRDAFTAEVGEKLGKLHAMRRANEAKAKQYKTLARSQTPKEKPQADPLAPKKKRKIPPAAMTSLKIARKLEAITAGIMVRIENLESLNMMLLMGEINDVSLGIMRDILDNAKQMIAASGGEEAVQTLVDEYEEIMETIQTQNEGIEEAANVDGLVNTLPMTNAQFDEMLREYDDVPDDVAPPPPVAAAPGAKPVAQRAVAVSSAAGGGGGGGLLKKKTAALLQ
jgi:hypothetical protein